MIGLDELSKLEQSIMTAAKTISSLVRERDKWKAMYGELSGQSKGIPAEDIEIPDDPESAVRLLEEENRMLKAKIQQVIHQTEDLQMEINSRMNRKIDNSFIDL